MGILLLYLELLQLLIYEIYVGYGFFTILSSIQLFTPPDNPILEELKSFTS
ncbi:hypothetical protein IMSAGC006_01004 [Muribaculaceae bacterium]|nr:hypothetical protein IMSAGC006_01004 [Muribaculaceae bacterium]